jgi:hypothetical protein
MAGRPMPPVLRQPQGSPKCWAYALSSWLQVTPGRRATGPEDLVHSFNRFLVFGGQGALDPSHIGEVLESPLVRMGWKVVDGATLKLDEVEALVENSLVFVVADFKRKTGNQPSHARLVWWNSLPRRANSNDRGQLGIVDPILGNATWQMSDVSQFNLILGFDKGKLEDHQPNNQPQFKPWIVNNGGNSVAQKFTPPSWENPTGF